MTNSLRLKGCGHSHGVPGTQPGTLWVRWVTMAVQYFPNSFAASHMATMFSTGTSAWMLCTAART